MIANKLKIRLLLLAVAVIILAVIVFFLFCDKEPVDVESGGSFLWAVYGLDAPHAVAVDSDENVYVSNTGAGEVRIYDSDGEFVRKLEPYRDEMEPDAAAAAYGQTQDAAAAAYGNAAAEAYGGAAAQAYGGYDKEAKFFAPFGIAVDNEREKIYVCDFNWRGVRVLARDGKILYNLPRNPNDITEPGADFIPYGVALLDDRVFIAAKDGVYIFDAEGAYLGRWGSRGQEKGQFNFSNGIATDPDSGTIYVADSLNRRLVAFNSDGEVQWALGTPDVEGEIKSPLQLPRSVAVGPDGLIYVSDTFSHRIDVFDKDGKLVSFFGKRGTNDLEFNFPEGLAFAGDRRLYIVDRGNNRLQAWLLAKELPKPSGSEVKKFSDSLGNQ